ncbi:MAG TPA: type IV pilin [Candidatus Altiarchaeales archaeon]|nr:type IV pilin [Candidatus Altiarchaeales archaeon]
MSTLKSLLRNRKGISNIMGALLLVAIVVVAAAGFAVMVSEIQKREMERRSNIAAVEGEELRIMSIDAVLDETDHQRMEMLNVSVLNLDSRESRLVTVLINDRGANNFTSTDDKGNPAIFSFHRRLKIPAAGSRVISINFTSNYDSRYNVSITEPLKITLFTERANNFKRIFTPPTAVVKTSIETEDLGVADRDILVLDGSESFDDGSIMEYRWLVFNKTLNLTHNLTGSKVRVSFNQFGPFYVNLEVTDDTKMIGFSESVKIPPNKKFNPPVSMNTTATYNITAGENTINVTVCDINGKPSEGVMVSFIRMLGNVTYSPLGDVTNSLGIASTTLTEGEGIIQIRSGRMNPIDVSVVQ